MCVGVPMRILAVSPGTALAEVDGETRTVSTLLLGHDPEIGQHVLVHMNSAIRLIDAEEARIVRDALAAVLAAERGQPFEHLVADLIAREPELPDHLKPALAN